MNPPVLTAARTRIKICGLTREEDVDAAVAAGADAIGFVLYAKSPRAVTPERAAQLAGYLHQHGIVSRLRDSAGQDIDGGCGQLRARSLSAVSVVSSGNASQER